MTPAARRILAAGSVLLLLLLGLAGLAFSPSAGAARAGAGGAGEAVDAEAPLLTAEQARTFDFFNQGRVSTGEGRGLFATDFFKPAPAPPPKPAPAAPTRRELAVFYRGLASFPDGARVGYVSVEGRTLMLAAGEAVTEGWLLASFDADSATLAKGEERLVLPFNRRAILSVPVKP